VTVCGDWEQERGFTLVELLIAIFIFTIVVSSVYGAYRATFRIVHGSEFHLATSRNASIAIERMTDDLSSIVSSPGGALRGERHDLHGTRGDSLVFISSAHLVLSKTDVFNGYTMIAYSIERDEQGGLLNLYRSDTVLVPGGEREEKGIRKEILAKGLKEVRFTYVDADGKQTDDWQSDKGQTMIGEDEQAAEVLLPKLVYLKLAFAEAIDSKGESVFTTAVALPQKAKSRK
jgi:general secretion pathway protein J